jgi:hypothetical protein
MPNAIIFDIETTSSQPSAHRLMYRHVVLTGVADSADVIAKKYGTASLLV